MLSSLGNQHDAVTAVRSDAHARLPPSHRHVGGRQPSVSGWSPRKIDGSEASHTQSSPDAVTGPLNHGSSTHVGGRQDSISGWSRKMVPESGVAHTHDAVTQLSGDTHVRVGGVDQSGRQESVSGWSRKFIDHGESGHLGHQDPLRRVFPTTASMAANNESTGALSAQGRRHFDDEARGETTVISADRRQRRHVGEPTSPPPRRIVHANTSPVCDSPQEVVRNVGQSQAALGAMPERGYPSSHSEMAQLARGQAFSFSPH